ncbi:MAG: hypothetical protein EXX96DRAFT_563717 [Benjaminiella poitrasii]|nr:MAG: hypothetical protein EXX96DRAFT_563717 [Benjaminiella poitrasii]
MYAYSNESYIMNIKLPPAVTVPAHILTLGYSLILIIDYILVKNESKLSSIVSQNQLRCIIATYHFVLPIAFASKYDFGNISFMIQPWTLAAQIVFLANSDMTLLGDWLPKLIKTATFQDDRPTTETSMEIRLSGLKKVMRGIAKMSFMKVVLDGLLPEDLSSLLELPFYSPRAWFITYVLAFRIYCMLSVVDIVTGVFQASFLIRFHDIFDSPFIATR